MSITQLNSSYCKPTTEKEEKLIFDDLGATLIDRGKYKGCAIYMPNPFFDKNLKSYTETTVEKFADMIDDVIVGWRLEEHGFEYRDASKIWVLHIENIVDGWVQDYYVKYRDKKIHIGGNETTITKFSELLTLIKFLTIKEKTFGTN